MLKLFIPSGDTSELRSLGQQLIAQADASDKRKAQVTQAVNQLADAANSLKNLLR